MYWEENLFHLSFVLCSQYIIWRPTYHCTCTRRLGGLSLHIFLGLRPIMCFIFFSAVLFGRLLIPFDGVSVACTKLQRIHPFQSYLSQKFWRGFLYLVEYDGQRSSYQSFRECSIRVQRKVLHVPADSTLTIFRTRLLAFLFQRWAGRECFAVSINLYLLLSHCQHNMTLLYQ